MATFMIFTKESTYNQSEIDIYQSQVRATFEGHPLKLLAAGVPQSLEGESSEGIVIIEFPTSNSALEWYKSPDYQAIIQHRLQGAKYRVTLVESL